MRSLLAVGGVQETEVEATAARSAVPISGMKINRVFMATSLRFGDFCRALFIIWLFRNWARRIER